MEDGSMVVEENEAIASKEIVTKVMPIQNKEDQVENDASKYQSCTLRLNSHNSRRRLDLLPSYPLGEKNSHHKSLLLLSNVPNINRNELEKESFNGGVCPFIFTEHRFDQSINSFFINLYRDLFIESNKRWNIDYHIIDYNLDRLRKCMQKYTKQTGKPAFLSLDELSMAFEFFLQIDVDLFYMKTCNFRDAQPRLFGSNNDEPEGIFCRAKPIASYAMLACYRDKCFLCQPWREWQQGQRKKIITTAVEFSPNRIHRFVNKYQAILNCQANCDTANVIYVLTCPCGQYDYLGSTSGTFYDRMLYHREEGNRMIREFLIGPNNIEHIMKQGTHSQSAAEEILLYQHSIKCPLVLQRFLDNNPEYWCLVPMPCLEAKEDDDKVASATNLITTTVVVHNNLEQQSPAFVKKTMFFAQVMGGHMRSQEEAIWLAKSVPKSPMSYRFSQRQIQQQIDFFKYKKETHIQPSNLVDLYNYTIVSVLPIDCSNELRRFIEALFITHAETNLNIIRRLTQNKSTSTSFDFPNQRGHWCKELSRQ